MQLDLHWLSLIHISGSKEGAISGTLTIICNTGQSRQSEIPQLPNDPEEQIEQLGE